MEIFEKVGCLMGGLLALLAALGYTSSNVFIRRGLMEEEPGNVWEINFVVSLITLLIFLTGISVATIFGFNILQEFQYLNLFAVLLLMLDGALGPLLGRLFMITATSQIGASHASALRGGSNPFFATILAIIFLKESADVLGIVGVLMIIGGIIAVGYKGHKGTIILLPKTKIAGGILALLGGLAYALSHIARGEALNQGATPNTGLIVGITTALVILTIHCRIKSGDFEFIKLINRKSLYFYSLAGISGLVGRYALLFSFVLIPVWQAVAIRNSQPVLAILLTWIFLKQVDKINLRLVMGATLVTLGVVILNVY